MATDKARVTLEPEPTVPHVSVGEVIGEDGSKMWCMHAAGVETGDLWACDADRRNMARVQLDRAGCIAAAELLLALAEVLPS